MSGTTVANMRAIPCPVQKPVGAITPNNAASAVSFGPITFDGQKGIIVALSTGDGDRLAAILHPGKAAEFARLLLELSTDGGRHG